MITNKLQSISHQTKKDFQSGFKWNLWGSTIFETLRVGHNLLLAYFLDPALYGLIGTLFATTYLAVRIADGGIAYTIHPYFQLFTKNERSFKKLLFTYFLLPLIPTLIGALSVFYFFTRHQIPTQNYGIYFFIFFILIISETVRSFFRQFLHVAFKSKPTIKIEFILFISYLAIVWVPYFCFNKSLTLMTIFLPFLIDSIIAILFFSILIKKIYTELPNNNNNETEIPPKLWGRLLSTRFFDFMLRLSRDLFTTNILTPLFALKFGLKEAGVFYLISTIAIAIQTIIRTTVGHPGNALLAAIKEHTPQAKKDAFVLLSSKLSNLLFPSLFLIIISYKFFEKITINYHINSSIILFAYVYSIMILSDLFFVLYESFYILEEKVAPICLIKLVEFCIFYGIIMSKQQISPLLIVSMLLIIRCLSFLSIGFYAFYRWQLVPSINIRFKSLGVCTSLALLITFFW